MTKTTKIFDMKLILMTIGTTLLLSCQPVPHSIPPETVMTPKDSLIVAVLSADTNYSDWLYNIGQASPEQYREALTYKIQAIYGLPDSAKIGAIVGYIRDSLK